MAKLRVLDILLETTADGPGFRTSFYLAGCKHNCPGCHNPQSHDPNGGAEYDIDDLVHIALDDEFANVTLSGGDPLFQIDGVIELCKKIKELSDKTIWVYTGYRIEKIQQTRYLARMLPYIDVLVDGRYEEGLRDESLPYRGSSNQRIIMVDKYLKGEKDYEWHLE